MKVVTQLCPSCELCKDCDAKMLLSGRLINMGLFMCKFRLDESVLLYLYETSAILFPCAGTIGKSFLL